MKKNTLDVTAYSAVAIPHLQELVRRNQAVMRQVTERIVRDVSRGRTLFAFGSGHSGLFALELYHRAGGVSFLVPIVADYLLPSAGPPVVRVLERTGDAATALLKRAEPKRGEMIWIASQSGINSAVIDVALKAKELGLFTVAFTSLVHSRAVKSRHASGKRLFEVCDATVDLGGRVGDACVPIGPDLSAGPLSTLGAVFLGHSILVAAAAALERKGRRCVYTSVNTPAGEARNRGLEKIAQKRDPLLR